MKTFETYISELSSAVTSETLDGLSVRMDIEGIGCIHIDGTTVTAEKLPADCVLTASHSIYDQLYSGAIDPAIAFGTGELSMDGAMAVALKVPALFAKARG